MSVDIWNWVHGKARELAEKEELLLANAMYSITYAKGKNVDAIFGPALLRAQELGETWVAVYLRHWYLQNLIFYGTDLRKALPEAASLIEYATRPENRDCPQSICAVEDLSCALGMKEGPAYAQDRIKIVEDTMQQIEPERDCYDCMLEELCDAYLDAGEWAQFETIFLESGPHRRRGIDPRRYPNYYLLMSKLASKKGDKALMAECAAKAPGSTDYKAAQARLIGAELCLMEGRFGDALAALGDWDDALKKAGLLPISCRIANAALEGGQDAIADRALWIERLGQAIRHMAEAGMSYPALDAAIRAAPLLATQSVQSAVALLDAVAPELEELKEPERIRPRFEAARQALLAS